MLAPLLALAAAPASGALPQAEAVEGRYGEHLATIGGLDDPSEARFAADGSIWVLERGAHRLRRFDAEGRELAVVGRYGTAVGELRFPEGFAVAADGALVVCDTGNDRVQVFAEGGGVLRTFGASGEEAARLRRPARVAIGGEAIAVADAGRDRVALFDREGGFLRELGTRPGEGGGVRGREPAVLARPQGLAFDGEGRLWVADAGAQGIRAFASDGGLARAFGDRGPHPGLFARPTGVAWHEGRLYVADTENHRVQVFDRGGDHLYEWGIHAIRPGEGEGRLHYPVAVDVAPDGSRALVAEALPDRVQVFGRTDEDPARFMTDPRLLATGGPTHFGPPLAAGERVMAVVRPEAQEVAVFDLAHAADPIEITTFGGAGDRVGEYLDASDVAIGAGGLEIWVTDREAGRVEEHRLALEPGAPPAYVPGLARLVRSIELEAWLGRVAPDAPRKSAPTAVAVDAAGRVFVADARHGRVLAIAPSLDAVAILGGAGSRPLANPVDLAVDEAGGRLLVVERDARRLVAFALRPELVPSPEPVPTGVLDEPAGVAAAADGTVYVTDAGAHRVVAVEPEGGVRTFGRLGIGAGELFEPRGVAIGAEGEVLVLDHGNHRLCTFTADGDFVRAFGPRLYVRPTRDGER